MSMVVVRDLQKVFRQGDSEVQALAGVSLDVAAGEFLSIMGPSGSGKSTLLHLIGGLDQASAGEIRIDGRVLSRMTDDEITVFRRRKIGIVFQFFNLLPAHSAEENVALPLLLDHRRPRDVRPRVEAALAQVGLLHRRRHRPDELSGGEMQRVAIARALVIDPAVILADEPTGNLDTRTGEEILGLLREANQARRATILLVTHEARAAACGSRIVTLKDGVVVSETTTSPSAVAPS
ncbi:MAG: ABC transporter ATP-binding protein [Deltaproteobacteria bacterium]|nr:MAG: ABC transporter ATP-binding protein [Deltaproteobacteria bacterium]TMA87816.1 MAG: ABC transporter ATP-binding protein [Deltaproteobacteria bacterium]TMB15955.1 MAG: ABC transporter ATP-binding protein [Deltaproteobacteria bacterium]